MQKRALVLIFENLCKGNAEATPSLCCVRGRNTPCIGHQSQNTHNHSRVHTWVLSQFSLQLTWCACFWNVGWKWGTRKNSHQNQTRSLSVLWMRINVQIMDAGILEQSFNIRQQPGNGTTASTTNCKWNSSNHDISHNLCGLELR